jgi:tetraacyldisaccharide 4'-kinase
MTNRKNILLYPLSLIYGIITGIRNFLYNNGILRSVEFPIPIICVGNLTVGGTGKTPHTEYIAGLLRENFKVATLSRGYKRKTSDFRIASSSSDVSEIGDEPLQIHHKYPDVLVTVDKNRVHGVSRILEESPETEVIILDDGFQHRRIKPGFSIILTDFERLFCNDYLLPYGRLREGKDNIRRANMILITKTPDNYSPIQRRLIVKDICKSLYQNLFFTSFRYSDPVPVFESENAILNPMQTQECGVVLITGIANPLPLYDYLKKTFSEIIHLSFPDHYDFEENDIQAFSSAYDKLKSKVRCIFTTEKDAVRLRELKNISDPLRSALYFIPVTVCFSNGDKEEFDKTIVEYVRKNKRNNRLSKV